MQTTLIPDTTEKNKQSYAKHKQMNGVITFHIATTYTYAEHKQTKVLSDLVSLTLYVLRLHFVSYYVNISRYANENSNLHFCRLLRSNRTIIVDKTLWQEKNCFIFWVQD